MDTKIDEKYMNCVSSKYEKFLIMSQRYHKSFWYHNQSTLKPQAVTLTSQPLNSETTVSHTDTFYTKFFDLKQY
jgi:hypothetical protein